MKSVKGQSMVVIVVLIGIISIISIMMIIFLLSGSAKSGNLFRQNVDQEIAFKIQEVEKRSVVAVTMNDHLWRANVTRNKYLEYDPSHPDTVDTPLSNFNGRIRQQVDSSSPLYNDTVPVLYNQSLARKITSYYFGTPSDEDSIYMNGTAIPKSEVREDLKKYYRYKLEKHFNRSATIVKYYFEITGGSNPDIVVKTPGYQPKVTQAVQAYPIALPGGGAVQARLWTSKSESKYEIDPGLAAT